MSDPSGRPEAARHITLDLASAIRPGEAAEDRLGCGDAHRPRAGDRQPRRCRKAQRDRRPFWLLRALSRARDRVGQPERAAPAGPHQHRARRADRALIRSGPMPKKIVSLDPYGHVVGEAFAELLAQGQDIRPTIAVTKARLTVPELKHAVRLEQLEPDGRVVTASGEVNCTKVALEPVWYLPGVAERCGVGETSLRRHLFEQTGGMFPELVTRPDLKVFLPPIGGQTAYIFGDVASARRPWARARLPGPRRVQRLGRVRLRHLHLPAVPRARHRGLHRDRAGRRRRPHRLQPQGGPGARRGHQVPRLQRAQAPDRRRQRGRLFRAHRMRRRACRTCASRS